MTAQKTAKGESALKKTLKLLYLGFFKTLDEFLWVFNES